MTSILELGIAGGEKNRQRRMDSIDFHIINSTSKCRDFHIWRNFKASLNFHYKLYQLDIQNNGNCQAQLQLQLQLQLELRLALHTLKCKKTELHLNPTPNLNLNLNLDPNPNLNPNLNLN